MCSSDLFKVLDEILPDPFLAGKAETVLAPAHRSIEKRPPAGILQIPESTSFSDVCCL